MSFLSDYIRLQKIGQGAFGTAWLIESKINSNKYVIKEIGLFKMQEKERLDAKKEVSLLSKMKHQNIVTYFDSFEENGYFHILMEYCDGGDLHRRMKSQNGILFKEDQVLDYFTQICLALKHIHDQKILHRDIKPQNVFLTKSDIVKLGDFGIAKAMDSTTALTKTTVGTPFYFSPEICEGCPYNNKSDIWSLGCILYELCSLNYAFYGQDITILAMRIKKVSYKPIPSGFSPPLRALVDNMFRRSPNERPNISTILRKPFIAKRMEKFVAPENPVIIDSKKLAQKRPFTANVVSRVDSGLKKKVQQNLKNGQEKRMQINIVKAEEYKPSHLLIQQHGIFNKNKIEAMNLDRENGWRNIISPDDSKSDNKEKVCYIKPQNHGSPQPAAIKQNINPPAYGHYYAELERIKEQRRLAEKDDKYMIQKIMKPQDNRQIHKFPIEVDGVYRKLDIGKQLEDRHANYDLSNLHGKLGANAGDQALIIQDYIERKRQARYMKARDGSAMAMVLGQGPRFDKLPVRQESPRIEDDIAEKLNKIRQKNFEKRQGQMFEDQLKKRDIEGAPVVEDFNQAEARKAVEELKKKLKQRTEEIKKKLEKKEREREKEKENKLFKDEELNNVILFPKRTPPAVNSPNNANIYAPSVQDPPSVSVLLEKMNPKVSPAGDTSKIESNSETASSQPSLSVIFSQMNDKPSRPSTASNSDQSEIRKLKDDILKRLNNKPCDLLNKVDLDIQETPVRKSWIYDMDEKNICKDTNLDRTTYGDCDTMVDVSFLNCDENEKNRAKWNVDESNVSDTMVLRNIKKGNDSQNLECDGSTMTLDEPSTHVDLPTVSEDTDSTTTYVDNSMKLSAIVEASQEITEIELKDETKEILPAFQREEVWKEDMKKETAQKTCDITPNDDDERTSDLLTNKQSAMIEIEEEIRNEDLDDVNTSDLSECEKEDLLECLQSVLSQNSSDCNSTNSNDEDDLKTLMTKIFDEEVKISSAASLQDLSQISKLKRRRIKSEGEININWDKGWSSEDTEAFSSEDFGDDETVNPENIFLKIEKIRVELEEKVGFEILIDAIDFVRENQDLNGDQLAEKLKEMISDEASINDILHLVVLEEQYNNFE